VPGPALLGAGCLRAASGKLTGTGLVRNVLAGAAAGAAGTTALNPTTYLDMVAGGRGTSSTPEQSVETIADRAHVTIPVTGATGPTGCPVSARSAGSVPVW
jgi:hypothetical protein